MKAIAILGAIAAAILFFFAIVFALAASVQATSTRLVTSGLLFIIGLSSCRLEYTSLLANPKQ